MRKFTVLFGIGVIALLFVASPLFGSSSASATSEPEVLNTASFPDLADEHPYVEAIKYLKEEGIVQGYPSGEYKPDHTLNRAEFSQILAGAVTDEMPAKDCFPDVTSNKWFSGAICYLQEQDVVAGFPDGKFHPERNINFSEAAKIIALIFEDNVEAAATGEPWYRPHVMALEARAAIPTSIDYMDKKLSRAEMAEMIWRLHAKNTDKETKHFEALESDLPQLASCVELKEKIDNLDYGRNRYDYLRGYSLPSSTFAIPMMALEETGGDSVDAYESVAESAGSLEMSKTASPTEGQSADDFSTTNIQVIGVDESDIIKNDGGHIYMVKNGTVRIIDAYPPEELAEVAKIEYEEFIPSELYVHENTLVVTGTSYEASDDYTYYYYSTSRAAVRVYDITDRTAPTLTRSLDFEGNMISSRRVGNQLYLVLNKASWNWAVPLEEAEGEDLVPKYSDSLEDEEMPVAPCSDIRFYPHFTDPNFLVVASVSLEDGAQSAVETEVSMGMGETVYASPKSVYVASTRYTYDEEEQYDIWEEQGTSDVSTIVFRFAMNEGDVSFVNRGSVPGTILNQFSMDEHEGHFRIATTVGDVWDSVRKSTNNLWILDETTMKRTGELTGLAPGEKIYSVRFMGDRVYMVTFKKVDPFYVIDASDPTAPAVLGYLKIPGYSDYLHPYDDNHILGFGKQAAVPSPEELGGREVDFAWYQGMKVALFDVTDPANPTLKFETSIGDRGTESELLHNHKALLFSKSRELLAFPVELYEIKDKVEGEYTGSMYGEFTFGGAYVYNLNLEDGFTLRGTVTHNDEPATDEEAQTDPYMWYNMDSISRIIYIGDSLYTISRDKVKALNFDSLEEQKRLEIEGAEEFDPWIYY